MVVAKVGLSIFTHFSFFLVTGLGVTTFIYSDSALSQTEYEIRTEKPDLEKEYRDELDKWMLRAYEGDRDAQFKVGVLFTNDQFDQPDYEQAVYWYKQAARQGHVLAQYNLGHQYLTGVGVEKSDGTAMQWWLEAAKQDHALAQFNVGRAYYLGIGLGEDHSQSKYWFERAAYNQEPKSIEILKQLGWYEGTVASKPVAPAVSETSDNVVLRSTQAAPEPGERSAAEPNLANGGIVGDESAVVASPSSVDSSLDSTAQNTVPAVAPVPAAVVITKSPVALYTNPAVRSVLISIIDQPEDIEISKSGEEWLTVTSKTGFPVWVHADFLKIEGDTGITTGQAINARSVPIIMEGTVVGKLNKDETVSILDKRKSWYRIMSPSRFKAWVKTEDYARYELTKEQNDKALAQQALAIANQVPVVEPIVAPVAIEATPAGIESEPVSNPEPSLTTSNRPINDNEWLFSQPTESYTLQLASFDDPVKINEFVRRNKFTEDGDLHRFTARVKDLEWTYFLYGSYSTRELADAAKLDRKQKRAWVRTFGRLQQNRCVAWKKQLPAPRELNKYCAQ